MGTSEARVPSGTMEGTFSQCLDSSEDPGGRPDGHVSDLDRGAHFRANFLF